MSLMSETALIGRDQNLTSSWDYRRRSRRVLHSCQLTVLHRYRHRRSHLRGSLRSSHAEPRPPHPLAPSFPPWLIPLGSWPGHVVLLWFLLSFPAPACSPPFPGSR